MGIDVATGELSFDDASLVVGRTLSLQMFQQHRDAHRFELRSPNTGYLNAHATLRIDGARSWCNSGSKVIVSRWSG